MRPRVVFVSGLPRSGSTLLCNILGQNSQFRVAGTSGLVDVLFETRNLWDKIKEFRAMPPRESTAAKYRVLRGMFDGYFAKGVTEDIRIHFDKSRTWLAHLEMAELLMGRKAKVIVCVRDIREVLASLEVLWRKTAAIRQIPQEASNYYAFQSLPGRLNCWMAPDGMVGLAYSRVRDAIERGYSDRMLMLDYDAWTVRPMLAMRRIEDFVEADGHFDYDFNNVPKITHEDDSAYDIPGLHDIRPKVEPQPSRWQEVLGEYGAQFGELNKVFFSDQEKTEPDVSSAVA